MGVVDLRTLANGLVVACVDKVSGERMGVCMVYFCHAFTRKPFDAHAEYNTRE